MSIQDIIDGKKKWRAHMARVKALPPDYQVVYKEIQRYLFRAGPADLADGALLRGIVDFFEEGVADGKGVLELIGSDVAAFCDDLAENSRTCDTGASAHPCRGRSPLRSSGSSGSQDVR